MNTTNNRETVPTTEELMRRSTAGIRFGGHVDATGRVHFTARLAALLDGNHATSAAAPSKPACK